MAPFVVDPNQPPGHAYAALAYFLLSGDQAQTQAAAADLAARELGAERPRIAALLGEPRFAALAELARQQGAEPEQLQRVLDGLVDRAGQPPQRASPLEAMLGPLVRAAAAGGDVDALLEQLRGQLAAAHPERSAAELDAFIAEFRTKLAAFETSAG